MEIAVERGFLRTRTRWHRGLKLAIIVLLELEVLILIMSLIDVNLESTLLIYDIMAQKEGRDTCMVSALTPKSV